MSLSVTIVTPSLNQGRFIERTIQSVVQQQYPNLKHLVFDGGSRDQTLDILKRYENSLSWVSVQDNGQAHAINKGFIALSSDIVGWLNSDDIYYPNAVSRVVDFFEKNPAVDVVYGNANNIDEEDRILSPYPTEEWNIERLKKTCFISQPAVFFRQKIIAQHGLLNEKLHYCLDYEFWLRLALNGVKFTFMKDILAGSRVYPETKTMRNPSVCYEEVLLMLQSRLGYIPMLWLLNYSIHCTKQLSKARYPGIQFILAALYRASFLSMRWNGYLRGFLSSLSLPKTIVELMLYKRKLSR